MREVGVSAGELAGSVGGKATAAPRTTASEGGRAAEIASKASSGSGAYSPRPGKIVNAETGCPPYTACDVLRGATGGTADTVGANVISESAINPALASRLDLYKAWKVDNDVVGAPSLKEFQLFDDPSRVQSNFKTYANKEWPPNSGALDGNSPFTLLPGTKIDRFGSDFGSYLSPTGTTYAERALRPGTQNSPYSVFEVTGRLDIEAATIRPWFGEMSMGTHFKLLEDTRVKTLLESGQLKEVYRGPYNGYKH